MFIDKSSGGLHPELLDRDWSYSATYLDDIAYYFYIKSNKLDFSQIGLIRHKDRNNIKLCYDKAFHVIRKEKLEEIEKNIKLIII